MSLEKREAGFSLSQAAAAGNAVTALESAQQAR
jgi:hypothetical protein